MNVKQLYNQKSIIKPRNNFVIKGKLLCILVWWTERHTDALLVQLTLGDSTWGLGLENNVHMLILLFQLQDILVENVTLQYFSTGTRKYFFIYFSLYFLLCKAIWSALWQEKCWKNKVGFQFQQVLRLVPDKLLTFDLNFWQKT